MNFTEAQIESLAPKPTAFKEGRKLGYAANWISFGKSDRAVWGVIQGSGANPYITKIDYHDLAYNCNCPSRQFPCKHALGLLLLFTDPTQTSKASTEEPEWVSSWMDKRISKAQSSTIEKQQPADESISDAAKEKRLQERVDSVDAGIEELELWLRDLVRIGLIELPSKPVSAFEMVAARMVDAKAPGLAGWVKALGKINYSSTRQWEDEAMQVIGKLYLLIKAWKNLHNLPEPWQQTIRNLVGWNQSTKDLSDDTTALAIKDEWLVLGQETETMEDLVIQRTWLCGCINQQKAMLLQFGTKFTPLQNMIAPGSIIEAEVAYFPGVFPHRAIIRKQKSVLPAFRHQPEFDNDLSIILDRQIDLAAQYPWVNEQTYMLNNARIIHLRNRWHIMDHKKAIMPLHASFDIEKYMQWIMITGNAPSAVSFAWKSKTAFLLGVFIQEQYLVL